MKALSIESSNPKLALVCPEAAIYARRSTEESRRDRENKAKQIESTIQTQTHGCLALASERHYHVAEDAIYQEHFTGMELWDRPILTELRTSIRAGKYQALICHSTDRLSREPIHLAIIAEECERAGCELIFVTEPLDNSAEAALIRYIKGYAAKMEREKLKERVKRQRTEIISKGYMICAGAPKFGYFWDKKKRCRIIDEQTAKVVYDIFQMTIDGLSGRMIADKLQAQHVQSPSRRQGRTYKDSRAEPLWNNTMISRILADEAYTGRTFVNQYKTTNTRLKNGKMKVVAAPRSEWVELPAGVTPPIITSDMFIEARRVIEANKKKANYKRNQRIPCLLRGLIYCSVCKNPMYPDLELIRVMKNRIRKTVGNKLVYRCSHWRRKVNRLNPEMKCNGGRVEGMFVEEAVWSKVLSFLSNPELIVSEVEKILAEMPDDSLRADLASAERELEKLHRVRTKMLYKWKEAVAEEDDDLAEQFDADIKRHADDIKAYKAVIDDLRSRIATLENVTQTVDKFQTYCALIADGMNEECTFEEKRAALQAFNVKVFTANKRPIRIRLNTGIMLQTARGPAQGPAAPLSKSRYSPQPLLQLRPDSSR